MRHTAMEDLVVDFERYLLGADLSHRTRAGYCADVRNYLNAVRGASDHPLIDDLALVTSSDIEQYLDTLSRAGARPATLRRNLAGIRRFFDYLARHGALEANPADHAGLRGSDEDILTQGQVLSVFRFLRLRSREVRPQRALSDELALMLLIFVGLRQRHIAALTASSFERQDGVLRVRLDPGQSAVIDGPVLGHLRSYLHRYPSEGRPLFGGTRKMRALLREIGAGLALTLTPSRVYRTHCRLRADPELACSLLSRIEDIHE